MRPHLKLRTECVHELLIYEVLNQTHSTCLIQGWTFVTEKFCPLSAYSRKQSEEVSVYYFGEIFSVLNLGKFIIPLLSGNPVPTPALSSMLTKSEWLLWPL